MPSQSPPQLFDRAFLQQRRRILAQRRAKGRGFLFRRARSEIIARLAALREDFPLALDLGWHGGRIRSRAIGRMVRSDFSPALAALSPRPCLAADEEYLPFAPARFALITSVLCLHWVNDLPGALIQIRQSLRANGLFLACLFGSGTLAELRGALLQAQSELQGQASPFVAPFADVPALGDLLQRAKFRDPVADRDVLAVDYAGIWPLLRDLAAMGEGNILQARAKRPLSRALVDRAGELMRGGGCVSGGRLRVHYELVYLTGRAP